MGLLFSRFRKKKTTLQLLDEIEQKIKSIEEFQKKTEQKFRRVIGKLIVSSILFYAVAVCGYYYYFSPDTFRENILKFVPLLVFPVIIIMSRKILSWYYRRKLSKNESTLKTLKTNKKKMLDEVMEKETYKVAKEILEKYAPEQLNTNSSKSITSNGNSKALVLTPAPQRDLVPRKRLTPNTPRRFDSLASSPVPNITGDIIPLNVGLVQPQPRLSLPRPLLPRDRNAFDKLVDMIIGDGPGNRYALICRVCSSHNGMALKHEFEFLSFRCAYCMQWNPARKQKPQAPNLALEMGSHDESDPNNSEPDTDEKSGSGESADISKTSELSETSVINDHVENKIENGDTEPFPRTSEDIDLSEVHRSVEKMQSNDVASEESKLLENTATHDMSIESDSR